MSPRRSSRRSFRVVWTTATHCWTSSATDYFVASRWCKTQPPAWPQTTVVVTTSHLCCGSCTGCQSVERVVFKMAGLVHQSLVGAAPVYFSDDCRICRTLVVAHCGPITLTCGSCSCSEHIINLVIGVFWPPVHDCGPAAKKLFFHMNSWWP